MGSFGTLPEGNVLGPASSTDNAVVRFDGTTGKLIQNSVALLTDTGELQLGNGAVGTPALSFTGDTNTGAWWVSTGLMAFGGDGLEVLRISAPTGANPQILLADGTAARPSYAWTSDTGMGLYRSGANTMTFVTGGASRMSFATAGITFASGSGMLSAAGVATLTAQGSITTGVGPSVRLNNSGSFTGASAITQLGTELAHTVNQSSTTGFTALRIDTTQTAVGSGQQLALDCTIAAVSKLSVASKGAISFTPGSPAAMAATENDYNGAGFTDVTFVRLTGNAANTVITGFVAPLPVPVGGVAAAQFKILVNIAAPTITINHQDAGSTAVNRVITSTGAAVVLNQDDSLLMIYDSTTARWRQITALA